VIQGDTLTCCSAPVYGLVTVDLGHADSFEYILETCSNCGAHRLNVFCVATAVTSHEPVSDADASAMLATTPGDERKSFMRDWGYRHL
jgi:hypothetical protein